MKLEMENLVFHGML